LRAAVCTNTRRSSASRFRKRHLARESKRMALKHK
jgi:hypothetical protein